MKKLLIVLLFVVAGTFLCGNALALETYIPHITGGTTDWTDYLQVNNNASSSANFRLYLYGSDGTEIYDQTISVGGYSRSQIELKALNFNAKTGKITYTEPGLVFRVSYNSWYGGVAEFKTIDSLGSKIGLYFSDFTSFIAWKGSAIANMGTTPAAVTLYALGGSTQGSGGSILATFPMTIDPKTKVEGAHTAWFSTLNLSQVESIVAVTGSSSLCGIAISGDTTLSRLLFTPATPVSNFNPVPSPVDVSGTWSGMGYAPQTGSLPTTLILSQNGNSVWGIWDSYSITGTISGTQLTLTITPFTQSGVYFTGGGSATVTGNSMSGTLSVTGSMGSATYTINGTFTATRSSYDTMHDAYNAPAGGFVAAAVGAIAK